MTDVRSLTEAADRYVDGGGTKCPRCESDDIEGSSFEVDAGIAGQEMICHECGMDWVDVYHLACIEISSDFLDEDGNMPPYITQEVCDICGAPCRSEGDVHPGVVVTAGQPLCDECNQQMLAGS